MLSVRDLVRQIPAEWQENVKHRAALSLPRVPRPDPATRAARAGSRRGSGASRRSPTSSTAGAATCRPSRSTWSRCRRRAARPTCSGSGSPRRSASTASTSQLDGERVNPSLGVARDRADPPHQPRGQRGARAGRTTARWSASCSPTRPCRAAPGPRGSPSRPTYTRGRASSRRRGSRRSARRGYDVIGDLDDLRGRPAGAGLRRPRPPRRGAGRPVPRSTRSRRCCSTTPGCSASSARPQRRAARHPAAARAAVPAADVPLAREARPPARGRQPRVACAMKAYRRARGRSSRSA